MKQKGLAPILIVLLIATLAVGGYLIYSQQAKSSSPRQTTQPSPTPSVIPTPNGIGETANWKTYTNTEWQYQVSYPNDWIVQENSADQLYLRSKESAGTIDIPKSDSPIYKYIQISVLSKTKASLEEEARFQGQIVPQCVENNPCEPLLAKQVQKKSDPRFKEFYEIINAESKKILVLPFPSEANHFILVSPFSTSKFHGEIPEKIFNQIFSTFKFTQ